MKNLKIGTVLLFLIGVISFTSCEKEEFIEDPIVEIDTSKLVNFKGLLVDHRFDTPIEDLEAEHNLSYLKMMLNKMKQKVAGNLQVKSSGMKAYTPFHIVCF